MSLTLLASQRGQARHVMVQLLNYEFLNGLKYRPFFGFPDCTPNMVYSSEQFIKLHGIHRSDIPILSKFMIRQKADAIKEVT